jgi:predicted ATP-dependent endonuclease of OLD family
MIIGTILKGYKAFNKTTYVPITDQFPFTAYIGDNGIGKSSILEALNTFFNNERFNRNKEQAKRGHSRLEDIAYVCPVFLLPKSEIESLKDEEKRIALAISKYIKVGPENALLADIRKHIENIPNIDAHEVLILSKYSQDKDFQDFLPSPAMNKAISKDRTEYSLLDDDFNTPSVEDYGSLKHLASLRETIINSYSYIYVPVETDEENFTKLESKTVAKLLDNNLFSEISRIVDAKKVCDEINSCLDKYLTEISNTLIELHYKGTYLTKFTPSLLVEKIIDGYFSTKTLHKKDLSIPISDLSAGEKRQAILSFSLALLEKAAQNKKGSRKVIFALDEPESSLHISRIYEQIEKLKNICSPSTQVIITTHWYGFIPILDSGWVHSITHTQNEIEIESFDLENFYHETRKAKTDSKGKRPFDTILKGNSELIQTIVNSIIKEEEPYTWIICEGITDAQYLKSFINHQKQEYNNRIKVIPVAGSKNVIKIYQLLHPLVQDHKDDIYAPIICLIDTDAELPSMENVHKSIENKLIFRRLCNNPNNEFKTELLDEGSKLTGITTIEDVLPPSAYIDTLSTFSEEIGFKPKEKIIKGHLYNSAQCLDLTNTERAAIRNFFSINNGANKMRFSNKFSEIYSEKPEDVNWISNLLEILAPLKKKKSKKIAA